ncbi:type IV pilus assembly protein PilV [Variovorax sp. TBS-050B]|uniref:type IV pilus modification PilV family protein n=1 Tax=Variovorax sp. TBS-050B TaxID=2940551 RepID=UPI0024751029|nr:prepilin-type N-terminal cleavage/methylation domain-containing protein [Variovorax sp. TBS-050B]MDH6591953.1 type IV pilus assembly protein PilV [Variovorax sp. TBS-050B]
MHAPLKARSRRASAPPRHRGIALIEVLVAMLIFMLGVLGLVGLQSTMTRTQTDSKLRADASNLASEVIGRMWVDIANLSGYQGTTTCTAPSCLEWRAKVATVLPSGSAVITVAASGDVAVTVSWTMPGGETHKYVTRSTIALRTAS